MAASGGCILDELQARMTALTDETPDAPRLFATTTALEDRVAELSAQHQDTSPTSKPKARAFAEDPPMVNSPQDIVNLASAPSSIASLSDSEKDEEDEEDASEAEQNLSDTEATKPKHKPKGSDPVPSFACHLAAAAKSFGARSDGVGVFMGDEVGMSRGIRQERAGFRRQSGRGAGRATRAFS